MVSSIASKMRIRFQLRVRQTASTSHRNGRQIRRVLQYQRQCGGYRHSNEIIHSAQNIQKHFDRLGEARKTSASKNQ